ncbi:UNVERIFIED_CONTAM: hypothetical protein Sradi_2047000 [Sesamum radiatum]|uniref:Reverse transcriptase domain-containing protein n=1 Tax=Sesamum radiatum TaxID=300843 RepID=A0AAW2TIG3_SESRA
MEVYVDDMLIENKEAHHHVEDLDETFPVLRKYRLKLNPGKCVFRVSGGCFLGFMVTQRGIDANPDKINAIMDSNGGRRGSTKRQKIQALKHLVDH